MREDLIIAFGPLKAADFRQNPRSLTPLVGLVAEHENVRKTCKFISLPIIDDILFVREQLILILEGVGY